MDDDQPYVQQHDGAPRYGALRAGLTRLGLALLAAVVCLTLVLGVGWAAAALW